MEVLRHGNTYKETECSECGALLSYCGSDIKKGYINESLFNIWHNVYTEYVICPECNIMIKLKRIIDGDE